jgi:hypothetical protein
MSKKAAQFQLAYSEAQALHIAALEYLRANDVTICGELVTGSYSPNSQLDSTARLAIRLNRYLLGGAHYNNRVAYDSGVSIIAASRSKAS